MKCLGKKTPNEKGKLTWVETEILPSFKDMNVYEKYIYLLQTYWTEYNFEKKFGRWIPRASFYDLLASVAKAEKGQRIIKNDYDAAGIIF